MQQLAHRDERGALRIVEMVERAMHAHQPITWDDAARLTAEPRRAAVGPAHRPG